MKASQKRTLTVLMFAVLAISTKANAGFIEEGVGEMSPANAQAPANASSAITNPALVPIEKARIGVVEIGRATQKQPFVRGFARDVTLLTALKQIVPTGWHAKRAGGLDVQKLVSWRGENRDWTVVLNQIATTYGFVATVNWETRELTVSPPEFTSASTGVNQVAEESKVVAPAADVVKTWKLSAQLTLKENVMAWAKEAGWQVSWAAVDYPVTNDVVLKGNSLDEEGGPLHQVVKAYQVAEQPITVSFWTNRVIRVENASFKQTPLKDEMPNYRVMK